MLSFSPTSLISLPLKTHNRVLGALVMVGIGVTLRLKSPSVIDLNLFAGAWLVDLVTRYRPQLRIFDVLPY